MSGSPLLYETEGGLVLLEGEEVLLSRPAKGAQEVGEAYAWMAGAAKERGIARVAVVSDTAAEELPKHGLETERASAEERGRLDSMKVAIMVKAGFAANEEVALALVREKALGAAEAVISEESSRQDLQLVQAIQSLDEVDRFLNIINERVFEWYSLHFPELPPILQDPLMLSRLIVENGRREGFEEEGLKGHGFSPKKVEAILVARERSKGGTISERDLSRVKGLSEIARTLAAEREKLADYVESSMKRVAPNVAAVAGSTIGARLVAKAGGMDRLARLPASTIQILGAEKALFRALRTGARPPKHGILFQHQAVHTAPKWQRGKIARTVANKVAIAARVDYYRKEGGTESGLPGLLEKRIEEIKIKYKEPRQTEPPKRGRGGFGKPFDRGKKWKERRRHKEPRSG